MGERRIGAYGGTFDPVHKGHIEVARTVVRNFELDELLIIPAYTPPHKRDQSISEAYHRYTMAVLASLEESKIRVSMIEIEAPDRPYTFETIERLRVDYGSDADFFFVMGADSFEEIGSWREPARLLASTKLIVTSRPAYDVRVGPALVRRSILDLRGRRTVDKVEIAGYRIFLTDWVDQDISSTEIRRMVRHGEPIAQLVAPQVADYIARYDLYRR